MFICRTGANRLLLIVSGLLCFSVEAISLPRLQANDQHPVTSQKDKLVLLHWNKWVSRGGYLTEDSAEDLEKRLRKNSDDLTFHLELIGHYFFLKTVEANQKESTHVLWLIRHYPGSDILRTFLPTPGLPTEEDRKQLKKVWQEQISKHPNQASVFGNAGFYFIVIQDEDAPNLLLKAHSLEPQNPQWLTFLGEYYRLKIHTSYLSEQQIKDNRQYASEAFDFYHRAFALTRDVGARISILTELAPLAFKAGRFEDAQNYSRMLLDMAQQHSKMIISSLATFTGNTILGELELKNKRVEQAKQRLLASANIAKAVSDKSLPDMSLARELLDANQRQTVIEFLTRCKQFCSRPEIDDWISEIERGLTPDFDKLPAFPK